MGFRVLRDWNKAAMAKHIWALALKGDTLWIKWVHTYVIKNQCLWSMPIPVTASWTIQKIFNLGALVQRRITYVVGKGDNIFLWLDN